MHPILLRSLVFGTFFGSYGAFLAGYGYMLNAAGHGTEIICAISSSPVFSPVCTEFLQEFDAAPLYSIGFFAAIMLWGTIGILLGVTRYRLAQVVFLGVMAIHYVALPGILSVQWNGHAQKMMAWVTFGLVFYGVGQLAIWVVFLLSVFGTMTLFEKAVGLDAPCKTTISDSKI